MGEEGDEAGRRLFAALKPLCLHLLQSPPWGGADSCLPSLVALKALVKDAPPLPLQLCFEYVLFPLELLLEAAVGCRSDLKDAAKPRLAVSDKVAETVLECLMELLRRCSFTDPNQMTLLFKKLAAAAMLSTTEASEEFRLGVVRCLRSMLLALKPCRLEDCTCRFCNLSSFIVLNRGFLRLNLEGSKAAMEDGVHEVGEERDSDCVIKALQSEDMAASVGHMLSVLLQIADAEAKRGRQGSSKLRMDSLSTLHILLLKVGTADQLAFFVPGIASGLARVVCGSRNVHGSNMLLQSQSLYTGGGSGAVEEAVRALADLLVLVLSDTRNTLCEQDSSTSSEEPSCSETRERSDEVHSAESVLTTIHELSSRPKRPSGSDSKLESMEAHSHLTSPLDEQSTGMVSRLRVQRDGKWLEYTAGKIKSLLLQCFPMVCLHPVQSVRLAAAESAGIILVACERTLNGCKSVLLECLLGLAFDDIPSVASTANLVLLLLVSKASYKNFLEETLDRLIERLPQAVLSGNQEVAVSYSRKVLGAMFFAGPDGVSRQILFSSASIDRFIATMIQCLNFDSVYAGSIQHLFLKKTNALGYIHGISELVAPTRENDGELTSSTLSMKLPRMPPWLHEKDGKGLFEILSNVLRLAGFCTTTASGGSSLFVLVEALLNPIRELALQPSKEAYDLMRLDEEGKMERQAATSVFLINEIIYGASGSCIHEISSLCGGESTTKEDSFCCSSQWEGFEGDRGCKVLCDSVGNILHDYTASELLDLPMPHGSASGDRLALMQVILEGIGIFAKSLKRKFEEHGFLASTVYLLLEKLGCSDYSLSSSADLALHTVATSCGYSSAKALVMANADHIIDSLCWHLRHLELHPSALDMLIAVLRYTGAAQDFLPLIEEPMRSIIWELEICARHQHPEYIIYILRALKEVVKVGKDGCSILLVKAMELTKEMQIYKISSVSGTEPKTLNSELAEVGKSVTKFQERRRTRQAVDSILTSCIKSCIPLLSLRDQYACHIALDVVEEVVASFAVMDLILTEEKEQSEIILDLKDTADYSATMENEATNKLLPTVHQIWPHLVACLQKDQPSVVVHSLSVIAQVTKHAGGNFMARRIRKDALPQMLRILSGKRNPSNNGTMTLFRSRGVVSSGVRGDDDGPSPASLQKEKEAVLYCIRDIAGDKQSASALDGDCLAPLAAAVVGLACGPDTQLQKAAAEAAVALSAVDADFVWVLVADLAYGDPLLGAEMLALPPGPDFPLLSEIIPQRSSEHALWAQQSSLGETMGISINKSAVQSLFSQIHAIG